MNKLSLKVADWLQRQFKARYLKLNRGNLMVRDFTVISSNCWGGIFYQDLGLPYKTPFVNMFVFAECFLKLVKNFKDYMSNELVVSYTSHYFEHPVSYPIGHLKDIEIHFIHYKPEDPVIEMWERRKQRINYDKLFFVLSERDGCKPQHIEEFSLIPFPKLMFTRYRYRYKDAYRIIPYDNQVVLPADILSGFTYRAIDPIRWVNQVFK